VLDHILPVRRVVVATQVGLELSAENLQRGTFTNTVGSDKTENLARSGHRQTVELEAVGAITVGDLALEVGGQVDDGDGVEGALLGADTATNTQRLGDEGEARFGRDLNAKLSTANHGAGLLALLATLARTTLFGGA
jgi:hypothetical protein